MSGDLLTGFLKPFHDANYQELLGNKGMKGKEKETHGEANYSLRYRAQDGYR